MSTESPPTPGIVDRRIIGYVLQKRVKISDTGQPYLKDVGQRLGIRDVARCVVSGWIAANAAGDGYDVLQAGKDALELSALQSTAVQRRVNDTPARPVPRRGFIG